MITCHIAMHARASRSRFYKEITTLNVSWIKASFLVTWFTEIQTSSTSHIINNVDVTVQFIHMDIAARVLCNTTKAFTRTSTYEVVNTTTFCFTINFKRFQSAHVIMAPHATIKGHVDFATLIF